MSAFESTERAVFLIANLVVNDPEGYRRYEKGFFPILKRFGGELLTYDDQPLTFEGNSPRPGRVVLLKFPSEDLARQWFADPQYQALCEHRRTSTSLEFLTMVRGLPPRSQAYA
jgi:uncharacterized protein (DUF1330 family)